MDMTQLGHVVISLVLAAVALIVRMHSRSLESRIAALEVLLEKFTAAIESTDGNDNNASLANDIDRRQLNRFARPRR